MNERDVLALAPKHLKGAETRVSVVTTQTPSGTDTLFRSVSPSEMLSGTPHDQLILVDTRDIPGQIASLISHLVALHFKGVAVLMTSFGHVPIWMRDANIPIQPAESKQHSEIVAWLTDHVIPVYSAATNRPFATPEFPGLVGISPPIEHTRSLLPRVSEHDRAPVLILGSSGTGKQVVARGIHDHGPRAGKSFVEVNCTALPDTLLESELFGRERGAYTDANTARSGLVETADNGTLFLDEIGHMSEKLQMALLKVIEQRTFRRVGGNEERTSSARFLAATSRNLEDAIATGEFRSDLYYRLNVFTLRLPDLDERDADVLLLAYHYSRQYAAEYGRTIVGLTGAASIMLLQHPWPGNVRELKNISERAVVLHDAEWLNSDALVADGSTPLQPKSNTIVPPSGGDAVHVDPSGAIRVNVPPWGVSLNAVERAVIEAALRATDYNISKTAKLLFISRDTLRYRVRKYGLENLEDG